jgi:hypothetical protein
MPAWLTTLFAALLGGFLSLAGVWMQLRSQQRQARDAARSSRSVVFARVLALMQQYNPDRAQRMLTAQEPMPRGWDAEQILAPVRDSLAACAADEPSTAKETLQLVDLLYAYFDALPGIDHWEGERAVVTAETPDGVRREVYSRIEEVATKQLRRLGR